MTHATIPDIDTTSEGRRTNALAYWRYGHDYLRAARSLCDRHRVICAEAQVNFHLGAQALEFALKAFLRARGVSAAALATEFGHSLDRALREALARGLPAPPEAVTSAVHMIAPHHGNDRFVYVPEAPSNFPDLERLFAAVHWVLDRIVPDVARDYTLHYSVDTSPSMDTFVARLRADLSATELAAPPLT